MSISNGAVLAEFGVSDWKANIVDKKVMHKIARDYRAGENAGRFHKDLLAGTTFRKRISDYAQNMRNYHSKMTLPWVDRGPRLLTLKVLPEYKATMGSMVAQLEQMIHEFTEDESSPNHYLNQIKLAQQAHDALGDMYDASEYPSLDEVRSKYAVRLFYSPVPEAGDFRVDAGAADLEFLKEQYEDVATKRVEQAQQDLWNRLFKRLEMAQQKVKDMDAYYEAKANGEKRSRVLLQDDYIDTLRDLCHLLGNLNVTGDSKLDKARERLLETFHGIDGEDLKEDAGCREQVSKELDKLRNDFW